MSNFKKVGLIARIGSEKIIKSLHRVAAFLDEEQLEIVLDQSAAGFLEAGTSVADSSVAVSSLDEIGKSCDLAIVVGGDGVILGAARALAPHGVPILGINRGRLGFLADVSPNEIEGKVGKVLAGDYTIESHFLLEAEVSLGRAEGDSGGSDTGVAVRSALNEVVVYSGEKHRMIEFDLFIDGQFVYKQYSDGLIVSTPTGSTAYSLSAGGPIMHPSLNALVLVPMFPHTLNSRPIVVSGECEIKVVVESKMGARVSFDSQIEIDAAQAESIVIRKRADTLKLIHPPGHSFYEVCRNKLDWASRQGE